MDDLKSHLNLQPYMAVIIITIQYLGNAVQPVQHGLIVDEQRFGCPGRITVGRIIGGKGVHQIGVVFPVMALQVLQAGGDIIFSGFPGRYVAQQAQDSQCLIAYDGFIRGVGDFQRLQRILIAFADIGNLLLCGSDSLIHFLYD